MPVAPQELLESINRLKKAGRALTEKAKEELELLADAIGAGARVAPGRFKLKEKKVSLSRRVKR